MGRSKLLSALVSFQFRQSPEQIPPHMRKAECDFVDFPGCCSSHPPGFN